MASRRSVLIGLGGLVAGGGAILGTGAFDTVEAQRTVSVETTGDADALLALTPVNEDGPYVDDSGDTIQLTLGDADGNGLNQNAVTTFEELVAVTNNGTQTVDSITFTVDVTGTGSDDANADHEEAFGIVANGETIAATGDTNILSDDYYDTSLDSGEAVNFGAEIDLLNGDISDFNDDATFTLTISAEATDS
ncbi:hypothetical protein J2744_001640 [Halorubrum trapanicum]|uniref:DUF1102 domain-containing protein n=1 Tax=Halorubrum trapanicum TaxID=29284 RepID=A0A8J7RUN7_9EURY|nr:hypothetical protein [Halorubrum trapanicum]MBP1901957.1 hypothetical protein [Halorubrum trapanicum]